MAKVTIPRAAFINALENEIEKENAHGMLAETFLCMLLSNHLDRGDNKSIEVEFDELED